MNFILSLTNLALTLQEIYKISFHYSCTKETLFTLGFPKVNLSKGIYLSQHLKGKNEV